MKAPLSWLREYVAIDLSPGELASRLALTGTEVERVAEVGVPHKDEVLERFVVAKVREREQHPDADKLSVCLVDVGEESPRTIVCGAPNVAAGQTVAVSLPGAVLPNGMAIGEAKLRGVLSSGMILSEAELGFEQKSPGIMVLPDDWEAGEPLSSRLPLAEHVLEVEVTPNRPDCLSIMGLAREIAAATEAVFCEGEDQSFPTSGRPAEDDVAVEVWDPDLCPRYAARVIRGVKIEPSPPWLKARIAHAGMRPVNNVVDITNYVMWTVGQPLHAFDLSTVEGGRVIARRATEGERILTLDGTERVLTPDMLVIADAVKPSVIAGIMGSVDSEVTDSTTDLLLEAANFHGPSIMRTSSALGLRSESSTRFEKGIDRNLVPPALDMACSMICRICGGEVSKGTLDVLAAETGPTTLSLRPHRVTEILGAEVPTSEIESILGNLGCDVDEDPADDTRLLVTVPTFRGDLEREIDLVEEVARIHGLDLLPATLPPRTEGRGGLTETQRSVRAVGDSLVGAGLDEVVTYSFVDPTWCEHLRLEEGDDRADPIVLANPLSQDQSVMRTMLLPGLLATGARNASVREDSVHVFEIGRTFHKSDHELPDETRRLGILMLGPWEVGSWNAEDRGPDFFLIKGVVERVLDVMGVEAAYGRVDEPFLHPGKSASIDVDSKSLGWVGEVHPLTLKAFDLAGPVFAAELDLDAVISLRPGVTLYEDLLTYPVLEQDLALVVDENLPSIDVVGAVLAAGGDLLRDARVFDVYSGPQVGEGKKSLALRLTFRSSERTLQEAEVNELRAAMLEQLAASIGAVIRA
jgi:phenylalanyl-tRNA synthetase beta chain